MRLLRTLASALVLMALFVSVGSSPSPVYAEVPPAVQDQLWQHTCVDVAQGTVLLEEALVCVHAGFPMWVDHVLNVVERICEHPLGGTYEYRSEFPNEFAGCFFL